MAKRRRAMAKMTLMTDEWLAEMKRTVILWRDEGYRPPLIVTEKLIAEVVRLLDEQDAWRTAVAEHEENAKKWKAEADRLREENKRLQSNYESLAADYWAREGSSDG